ncbi:hypothetical protein GCM10027167_81670 [Nocardia heshunensis]
MLPFPDARVRPFAVGSAATVARGRNRMLAQGNRRDQQTILRRAVLVPLTVVRGLPRLGSIRPGAFNGRVLAASSLG